MHKFYGSLHVIYTYMYIHIQNIHSNKIPLQYHMNMKLHVHTDFDSSDVKRCLTTDISAHYSGITWEWCSRGRLITYKTCSFHKHTCTHTLDYSMHINVDYYTHIEQEVAYPTYEQPGNRGCSNHSNFWITKDGSWFIIIKIHVVQLPIHVVLLCCLWTLHQHPWGRTNPTTWTEKWANISILWVWRNIPSAVLRWSMCIG